MSLIKYSSHYNSLSPPQPSEVLILSKAINCFLKLYLMELCVFVVLEDGL